MAPHISAFDTRTYKNNYVQVLTTFQVRDNGRGIAAEDIPKVFDLFRRVGKQGVPGEGMGLAYVRTLVRRHGGDIGCQSALGDGTTFTFTLVKGLAPGHLTGS